MADDLIPAPPVELKAAGKRLWLEAVAAFDFSFAERVRLEAAAHEADEIVRLQRALARAPTLTTGSAGQKVTHPLFASLIAHRAALSRLLGELGIASAAAGEDAGLERSSAGRAMARQRWGKRGA